MRELAAVAILTCFLTGAAYAGGKEVTKYVLQADRIGPVSVGLTPKEAGTNLAMPFEYVAPRGNEDRGCYYVSPKGYSADLAFYGRGWPHHQE